MLGTGAERSATRGGLHRFMNWPHPILTDCGGVQVMSLSPLQKVAADGVTFRSHLDGTMVALTPERAVEIQDLLGADTAMQLDECVKLPAERTEVERAMRLSLSWAERSKRAFERAKDRALFGIVQGGTEPALRLESARALIDIAFPGYAIGGLAVGEPQQVMLAILDLVTPVLPEDRPRYLMGVGTPRVPVAAGSRGSGVGARIRPPGNGGRRTGWNPRAPPEGSFFGDGSQSACQRLDPHGRGRCGHAAALCAAQRSRAQRREIRLRPRPMRRLHGSRPRARGALVRDPDRPGRRSPPSPDPRPPPPPPAA